jgi:hypothetical protein
MVVVRILGNALMERKEIIMKVYEVIDDSKPVLVTADELTALRMLRKIMEKHDVTWGWITDLEVK